MMYKKDKKLQKNLYNAIAIFLYLLLLVISLPSNALALRPPSHKTTVVGKNAQASRGVELPLDASDQPPGNIPTSVLVLESQEDSEIPPHFLEMRDIYILYHRYSILKGMVLMA